MYYILEGAAIMILNPYDTTDTHMAPKSWTWSSVLATEQISVLQRQKFLQGIANQQDATRNTKQPWLVINQTAWKEQMALNTTVFP